MKYTREEILNALKILKETCGEQTECKKCPFGNADGDCLIVEECPGLYTLNEGTNIWRALK